MAIPVAVKVAATIVTDKKLRRAAGGILLGIVIVIVAPIAVLLAVVDAGRNIDWTSPEMLTAIEAGMTNEEKARMQHFASIMQAIEDEINAQGLDIAPIKAQVIFLCALRDHPETDTLYADFVACFAGAPDDDTLFANITARFGVGFTAEEKRIILLLVSSAVEHQTVPPTSLHKEIADALAGDTTPVSADAFRSPFHDRDWRDCLNSGFGNRKDPITGEDTKHAGIDLGAPKGTAIHASKPGTVLFVRYDAANYGHYVVINHGGKQATVYAHCSKVLVAEGGAVTTDTVIAQVGSTGRSTGDHLHFEIIMDGQPVDPEKYLEAP